MHAGKILTHNVLNMFSASLSIINKGYSFIATAERNVTIRCIASSDITPQVKMMRNEVELKKTVTRVSSDKTVVFEELTINPVKTEDSGVYTCVAWNRQKSAEADIRLVVNGKVYIL
jgi:hypothetical protein